MEGNQMKMRETLLVVRDALDTISAHEDDIEFVRAWIAQTKDAVQEALSAPPRNCDRKFVDRVDMYYAFKDWCHAKGHTMKPLLASDAFDWFLETATEKE